MRWAVRLPFPGRAGHGRAIAVASTVLLVAGCAAPVGLGTTIERALEAGPGRNSPAYRQPTALTSHRLAGAVLTLLAGADDPAAPEGVRVLEAVDADGRPIRVVIEDPSGPSARGLGVYAVREGAGTPPRLVVEVPHPRADRWTEDLGAELFSSLQAQVLLVAGAHRTAGGGAADVAHRPASAFAAVDRAVVGPGTVVLQLHGFSESRHPGPAEIVLSSGEATATPLVEDLGLALEDAGFTTCVYDGERCRALAGTTNAQAAHARGVGATFVHLELALELRRSGPARARLVEVIGEVLPG